MANLDNNVTVNVSADSPALNSVNFGVPLILGVADAFEAGFTERYRSYTSAAAVAADGDLSAAAAAAATAAFAQNPSVATVAVGRVASAEADDDALDAILAENSNFYAVCPVTRTKANLIDVADWVEANGRIAILQSSDADLLTAAGTSLSDTLFDAGNTRSAVIYHATDAQHANVALAAKTLAANPDVVTTTWSNKTLAGVTVASLTSTQLGNLVTEKGNVYGNFRGLGAVWPGRMVNGRPIDVQLTMDWVQARVGERIAQLFVNQSNKNLKVPYNDIGIQMVAAQIRATLLQGVAAGHFNEGQWRVDAPKRSAVTPADVTARQLTISFEAELAGAIEKATVNGYVVTNFSG